MKRNLLKYILFSRLRVRLLMIFLAFLGTSLGLASPLIQKQFIDSFITSGAPTVLPHFLQMTPLALVSLAFLTMILGMAMIQLTNYIGAKESLVAQQDIARMIYEKTLQLKVDVSSSLQIGEIVSLYAVDGPAATILIDQTIPFGATSLFPFILAPIAISYLFSIPVWPILAVIISTTLVSTALAFRQSKFFFTFKKLAASRIGLVNEWVQNIRTLRILGWTSHYEKMIFEKRELETENRVQMVTNGQIMNTISTSVTFALNIIGILTLLSISKKDPTNSELMAMLWILGLFLTRPFRQLPWFFTFAFDALTSIKRIENFLNIDNTVLTIVHSKSESSKQNLQLETNNIITKNATLPLCLEIKNLKLDIKGAAILKNINLEIKENEFIAIVGEVGSGKSLFLLSLLGETGAEYDIYKINGKSVDPKNLQELKSNFSYSPQEGFIMSANLRENVAFQYDLDERLDPLIKELLLNSQFDLSIENLPNNLGTEIGERGVNLSGGQKQRINLARAQFNPGKIVLLDDCLSAVDVETEKKLVQQLVNGKWRNFTRILTTHRLSILNQVDRVIFLKNGEISDQGNYEFLLKNNPSFREFALSIRNKNEKF